MRELDLLEMEKIEGGDVGCACAVAGTVAAFAGLFFLGPVTGGASWAVLALGTGGFVLNAAGMGYSCS
jgi:hypothetical protein